MIKNRTHRRPVPQPKGIILSLPSLGSRATRIKILLGILLFSNLISHYYLNPQFFGRKLPGERLYLLGEAEKFVPDIQTFEEKVREVASSLQVPAEWLMAIMYAESGFNSSVYNRKGSGAVGLIQFMPATARELHTAGGELESMDPVDQMDVVHQYLHQVRERYGEYRSLTDLYLAVLYPKARGMDDPCFALYAKPSKKYEQNSGLDENRDGVVTISDIDRRMQRLYMTAWMKTSEIAAR